MSAEGTILYPYEYQGSCDITTAIPQRPADRLRLYPNPTVDELIVEHPAAIHSLPYVVLAPDGRIVLRGLIQGKSGRISTADLPNGCYMIKIEEPGRSSNTTFLKVDSWTRIRSRMLFHVDVLVVDRNRERSII